jgi:pimeloyl-ACP methyl ester carboxylesterase
MPSPRVPLVLLPGLVNDARLWQHQIAGLDDTTTPIVGDLTGADSVVVLASQVLARVTQPRFVLAGFSMGGYVAWEIMRVAPERVLALALLDTSARPDTPEATRQRRDAVAQARQDYRAVIDAMIRRVVHPDHADLPGIVEPMHAMARRVGVDGFARQQEAIIGRPDSRPTLSTIACPTLLVCGRQDPVTPLEVHEEMRDAIAGAQLVELGVCGHLSPLERPLEVTAALRTFVDRTPR